MKTIIHAMLGTTIFILILIFLAASLVSELWYPVDVIAGVRSQIFYAMLLLLPVLLTTAYLGLSLGKNRQEGIVDSKKKRMLWIFIIYIFIFMPTSYFLDQYSREAQFNSLYFLAQLIEYAFDLIVLVLVALNFRDGGRLVLNGVQQANRKISDSA